ncbi:MAG: phenylalanine--tRNA ligase subunit beta [Hydrotalea sp.]|nr:phenylalanine--tRNA ligase subunit beta [Hydrotalea sp.]
MKFTFSWLRDHLETSATPQAIADSLTALGLEVEAMTDKAQALKDFVIGEVTECGKHPNADKLSLCKVSDGNATFQVVCGAPNVRQGLKIVLARIGATIPRNGMVLEKGVIRGMESQAMICSAYELTLGDDHDGIIELPSDAPVGKNYAAWAGLDDVLFEIKLTPNRGDCLGVRGIARDLAAAGLGALKPFAPSAVKGDFASPINWVIEGNTKDACAVACPVVLGRYFKGVKNQPSPAWLKQKLQSVGLKSISALVDITNYLSQDLARPLHVFSGKKLGAGDLTMRFAKNGESLLALDEQTYDLRDDMLVIANGHGVQSLAGIMGGMDSGCKLDDDEVFLEVAYFNPMTIAKTGRALNLLSDARYRFERGVDPAGLMAGLDRATQLILEICGGTASTITTAGQPLPAKPAINFNPQIIKTLGGIDLPNDTIAQKLTALGFTIDKKKESWLVTPPTWRGDIENDHCLVEEVLRLHGFDNIPECPLPRAVATRVVDETGRRIMVMRRALAMRGFYETVTWSFTTEQLARDFGATEVITLQNPIHSDMNSLRPSVLCNLLLAVKNNQDRGFDDINLFEQGLAFRGVAPDEQWRAIAGVRYAPTQLHWQKNLPLDSFVLKADVAAAIAAIGFNPDNLQIKQDALPAHFHPGLAASLNLGRDTIGYFGALHPALLQHHSVDGPVFGFELFIDKIPASRAQSTRTRPPLLLNDLPRVTRDFAFVVDKKHSAASIIAAVKKSDKKYITAATIFDIYADAKTPEKQSVAVRVTITPDDKTLSDGDIKNLSDKIIAEVIKSTGGELRQ